MGENIRVLPANTTETDGSARQIHSIDVERLQSVCREEEMRQGLQREPSCIETALTYLLTCNRDHRLVFGSTESQLSRSVSDKTHDDS